MPPFSPLFSLLQRKVAFFVCIGLLVLSQGIFFRQQEEQQREPTSFEEQKPRQFYPHPRYFKSHQKNHAKTAPRRAKIALVTSFVPSYMWIGVERLNTPLLASLLQKACYAYEWGYEFVFNTTPALDAFVTQRNLVGAWHRVPHMQALFDPGDYDWVVYGDLDYWILQRNVSIESFLETIQQQHHSNIHHPSVLVPVDHASKTFAFSSFTVWIRNDDFGRRLLHHWRAFGNGLCGQGNFLPTTDEPVYQWRDSDQPGLWYALIQTHREFARTTTAAHHNTRNATTSTTWPDDWPRCRAPDYEYLEAQPMDAFHSDMDAYFKTHSHARRGLYGDMLDHVPTDQRIFWSTLSYPFVPQEAIGVNIKLRRKYASYVVPTAFAVHMDLHQVLSERPRQEWDEPQEAWERTLAARIKQDVDYCQRELGCYAYYDDNKDGELRVGCGNVEYVPHG